MLNENHLINLYKKVLFMNISKELERKLTSSEYDKVAYYIEKASQAYEEERYSTAKSSLEDAVAILKADGEYNAASKVSYYLRFC